MQMTPEQQAAYDAEYEAEMTKLNKSAEANATTTDEDENEVKTDPVEPKVEPEAKEKVVADAEALKTTETEETDPVKKLEARTASLEKALKDTKSWADKNAAELKRLRKEREQEQRAANRPQVLDDNPGLEEAIRHVTGERAPTEAAKDASESWAETVGTALPELDELLNNADFNAKAKAKAKELGDEWDNPIIAIRELGRLQREHERQTVSTDARLAAQRDFQQKGKKQTAMQMPSGSSGSSRQPAKLDDAAAIWDMSSADFAKMKAKTLGH